MRLLTHNYLQSNVRGTDKGYPLLIEPTEIVFEESPMDKELLIKMVQKLDYSVLRQAVQQIMTTTTITDTSADTSATAAAAATKITSSELPESLPADWMDDGTLLEELQRVVFGLHVLEGDLVCPDTGRKFPVREGIPNMILHEDEI